ncbi:hypothetical protein [Pedobacter psychroterrae]|uniref:DUF5723 domain-containing protein n=1 Tax=Pedobacter psychroterrae TaxID=2530453 RepID=A0A4V2MK06_9SPHI|nr:hypothetical protein [Pedobacter psychroterrae]TCC96416.1 hypothetical protein EZ437_21325 [Pedobacter psychroterrae]
MKNLSLFVVLSFLMMADVSYLSAQDVEQLIKAKPFTVNGTLGIGIGTYSSNGIPARQRAFSYLFNGAPTMSVYGVAFPFSVVVSDQQRGFRQPFNQYGISPTYKWATLHAGWQNLEFSPFTLAGHTFLGGGVELNPGKLRFGFIYGRFNKAIEEDPTLANSFGQTPAYRRTGYSAKIGLGSDVNHVDLIFLNAKDDPASINKPSLSSGLKPAENLVAGISSKFTFFKRLLFDMDVSGSIYTNDRLSDTVPNIQLKKVELIRKLVTLNTSTQLLAAGQTSLGYQGSNYNVLLRYRRVDPDYKSMGAYYFETDVQNYTVEGGLRLWKGQVQLNGSAGLQNDNILKDRAYQSNRKIGSLNLSYNKPAYGLDLRYSNYGITQDRGLNPIIDTLRVARTNHNINAMLRYNITGQTISQGFVLVGNVQSLVDLNTFTAAQTESDSKTLNFSYQLGFLPYAFGVNANINYTIADVSFGKTIFYGPSIGVDKQFSKGKYGLNASISYQQQQNNDKDAGNVMNGNLNGSYRISKRNAANVSLNYLKSKSKDATLPSFNELRSSLSLSHSF